MWTIAISVRRALRRRLWSSKSNLKSARCTTWRKFRDPDFPAMYFIEQSYSNDPTNWWIPNAGAVEAMLRSSGLKILDRPEVETWICSPASVTRNGSYIVDLELQGTL